MFFEAARPCLANCLTLPAMWLNSRSKESSMQWIHCTINVNNCETTAKPQKTARTYQKWYQPNFSNRRRRSSGRTPDRCQ